MRKFVSIGLLGAILCPFALQNAFSAENHWTLAQNELSTSTFDPFIDYGEFQDNVTEEESVNFFQNGRSLTLSFMGGYEALTLNMRQIYGDAPFVVGAGISFFLDLRFAFQVSGAFPSGHYNSLLNSSSSFSHFGIDLKYYLNRQYLTKDASFFNPYFVFGPFWLNIKAHIPQISAPQPIPLIQNPAQSPGQAIPPLDPLTRDEKQALASYNAAGVKAGLGLEIPFIKQSFIGVEVSYLYTVLQNENEDLSTLNLPPPNYNPNQSLIEKLQFPNRPQLEEYRFFGDLMNIIVLFGVNF